MESKGVAPGRLEKEEEEVKAADYSLLQRAVDYCESRRFSTRVRDFEDEHGHLFAHLDESGEGESTLEHTSLFEQYVELLEGLMESFLSEHGSTQQAFYIQCEEVLEGKFCALFEESEHKWFVDLLASWTDFQAFRRKMAQSCRRGGAGRK